jgi:hypothetical protein
MQTHPSVRAPTTTDCDRGSNVDTSSTDRCRLIFGTPLNGKVSFSFNDGSQTVAAAISAS